MRDRALRSQGRWVNSTVLTGWTLPSVAFWICSGVLMGTANPTPVMAAHANPPPPMWWNVTKQIEKIQCCCCCFCFFIDSSCFNEFLASTPFVCCCCATVERILATNNAHKKELSAKYEKRSKNWTEMDESVERENANKKGQSKSSHTYSAGRRRWAISRLRAWKI